MDCDSNNIKFRKECDRKEIKWEEKKLEMWNDQKQP